MVRQGKRFSRLHSVVLTGMLLLSVAIGGCQGCSCRRTPQKPMTAEELEKQRREQAEKMRQREEKKDLRVYRCASVPHEPFGPLPKIGTENLCFAKRGHWNLLEVTAKANNFDIVGDLEIREIRANRDAIPLPGTDFQLATRRSAALPKGQTKSLESRFFLPERLERSAAGAARADRPAAEMVFDGRRSARAYSETCPIFEMPFYQYHFVVLARYPESYTYLKSLDSVRDPRDLAVIDPSQADSYYRVSLLAPGRLARLPSEGLFWTTIAYLLWDDADPEALSLDQQVALLDWLHWGGQLIISGPETLETLRNSFLADYLPATSKGSRQLVAADFEAINAIWNLPIGGHEARPLAPIRKWPGVELELHPEAQFVPSTGGLLAERRIGRGRVLLSAFRLSRRALVAWPGFDGFFNGCILRRGPRRFGGDPDQFFVHWADGTDGSGSIAAQFDTRRLCGLWYFTRDAARRPAAYPLPDRLYRDLGFREPSLAGRESEALEAESLPAGSLQQVQGRNLAAWNDFGGVADAAREAILHASGIEVPERRFVVWVVLGYLLVLVPANWLIFRLLGRVEWAWAAAPLVAIICAMVVVRQAQLEIGFVRSQTELAVVEMQADYPRAHVTRYTSLYTSLATAYDFVSEELGALMMPFPPRGDPRENLLKLGESPTPVVYRYGSEAALDRFRVGTSRTGIAHSEQMLDFGGSWDWREDPATGCRLVNRTGYRVRGIGLVRKDAEGRLAAAWAGMLEPEESVDLAGRWRRVPEDWQGSLWPEQRERASQTAVLNDSGALSLHPLLALAEKPAGLRPGDVRLIGWTEEPIEGMEIVPRAPQRRHLALVVVHLRYGHHGPPKPDENTRWDFSKEPPRTLRAAEKEKPPAETDLQKTDG